MSAVGKAKNLEEIEQFSFEITINKENKEIRAIALQNLPKPDFSSLKRKSERLRIKTGLAVRAPIKKRSVPTRVNNLAARTLYFPTFNAKSAVG